MVTWICGWLAVRVVLPSRATSEQQDGEVVQALLQVLRSFTQEKKESKADANWGKKGKGGPQPMSLCKPFKRP